MAAPHVTLAVASFLDSPEAVELGGIPPQAVRSIAELFVELCFERLGKKPALLEAEDLEGLFQVEMPSRMGVGDPLAEQVPAVVNSYLDHLEGVELVPHAFEIRNALEENLERFVAIVRSGENAAFQAQVRVDPIVNKARKLGRNDPCSCGSGKKYKKCHGRNG